MTLGANGISACSGGGTAVIVLGPLTCAIILLVLVGLWTPDASLVVGVMLR